MIVILSALLSTLRVARHSYAYCGSGHRDDKEGDCKLNGLWC